MTDKNTKTNEPIYVITGKDPSLLAEKCRRLLDKLLTPEQRAMALFNPDPAKVSITEVLDELRTLPFLSEKRVVLLKDADKFVSEHREILEKYFDNPASSAVLVMTVSSWPARTKLAKKLTTAGKLITVAQLKPWQLPDRLIKYAAEAHDKNINKSTAEFLIDLTGDDLIRLYSEIDKLALFAADEKTITPKHIESLIGNNRLFNAFSVIDSVIAGNIAQSVQRLRAMFASDKSTEFTIVGAFAYHFRRLFAARALMDKGVRPDQIASQLRIWGNKQGFFAQTRKMTLNQIGGNIQQLAAIDFGIKTGQTTARVAMEQLIFKLANKPAPRARATRNA